MYLNGKTLYKCFVPGGSNNGDFAGGVRKKIALLKKEGVRKNKIVDFEKKLYKIKK